MELHPDTESTTAQLLHPDTTQLGPNPEVLIKELQQHSQSLRKFPCPSCGVVNELKDLQQKHPDDVHCPACSAGYPLQRWLSSAMSVSEPRLAAAPEVYTAEPTLKELRSVLSTAACSRCNTAGELKLSLDEMREAYIRCGRCGSVLFTDGDEHRLIYKSSNVARMLMQERERKRTNFELSTTALFAPPAVDTKV